VPSTARHFQAIFNLTPVEVEITKTIVIGQSLTDLAESRGRSIGTVRNQTKALLAKLKIRSQTELSCLYSGFSKFHADAHLEELQNSQPGKLPDNHEVMIMGPDRILNYEIIGHSKGEPVLFLPALIGGASFTRAMRKALVEAKIKLIVVWRPFFANSSPSEPPGRAAISAHANDCIALMDHLGVKTAKAIGHISSIMFAMCLAKEHPERIIKVVNINGILPSLRGEHLKHIDKIERFRHFINRHAPKIARTAIFAYINRIDSGFDEEIMAKQFVKTPRDIETIDEPEIKPLFRNAFTISTRQTYESFVQELQTIVSDWHDLFSDVHVPIKWLIGIENRNYTEECLKDFLRTAVDGNVIKIDIDVIEDTAHLLLWQDFNAVINALKEENPAIS